MIEIMFWVCLTILLYIIFGYPLCVIMLSRFFGQDGRSDGHRPRSFTFLIAAYNEEACIREKIENCLALAETSKFDLQIIVISDGSTDRTVEEIRAVTDSRVQLIVPEVRSGKALALNQILPLANRDIIIFTDANSLVAPGSLQAMSERFGDPAVGGVCGEIVVDKAKSGAISKGEGLYWKYDQSMKQAETRLGGAVSAQGSFYAIRPQFAAPFVPDCADDFYNSVRVVAMGSRLAFEPRVRAFEHVTEGAKREMSRRIRSTERGWRALMAYKSLLNPLTHGWYAWQLLSHKALRRLTPFLILLLFLLNLALIGERWFYSLLAWFQIVLCVLITAAALNAWVRKLPVVRQLFFFAISNVAMALGLIRYMTGRRSTLWSPVREQQ